MHDGQKVVMDQIWSMALLLAIKVKLVTDDDAAAARDLCQRMNTRPVSIEHLEER